MTNQWATKTKTRRSIPPPENLEGLLEDLGIVIDWERSTGKNIIGHCPVHRERTGREDANPSWGIHRESGLFHCFSCGFRGNVAILISAVKGISYFDALRYLRGFGLDLSQIQKLPEFYDRAERANDDHLSGLALRKFTTAPPEALQRRGITDWAADFYGVKWDPRADGGTGRWVLPIRTLRGELLGYQLKGTVLRNMPPGVKKGETLFGIDKFAFGSPAILVESPLDVVRLQSEDISGGLSSFGVHVTEAQMQLLLEVTDELIVALDNDTHGERESRRLRDTWSKRFLMKFFRYTTSEKDIGEMAYDTIRYGINHAIHSTAY